MSRPKMDERVDSTLHVLECPTLLDAMTLVDRGLPSTLVLACLVAIKIVGTLQIDVVIDTIGRDNEVKMEIVKTAPTHLFP